MNFEIVEISPKDSVSLFVEKIELLRASANPFAADMSLDNQAEKSRLQNELDFIKKEIVSKKPRSIEEYLKSLNEIQSTIEGKKKSLKPTARGKSIDSRIKMAYKRASRPELMEVFRTTIEKFKKKEKNLSKELEYFEVEGYAYGDYGFRDLRFIRKYVFRILYMIHRTPAKFWNTFPFDDQVLPGGKGRARRYCIHMGKFLFPKGKILLNMDWSVRKNRLYPLAELKSFLALQMKVKIKPLILFYKLRGGSVNGCWNIQKNDFTTIERVEKALRESNTRELFLAIKGKPLTSGPLTIPYKKNKTFVEKIVYNLEVLFDSLLLAYVKEDYQAVKRKVKNLQVLENKLCHLEAVIPYHIVRQGSRPCFIKHCKNLRIFAEFSESLRDLGKKLESVPSDMEKYEKEMKFLKVQKRILIEQLKRIDPSDSRIEEYYLQNLEQSENLDDENFLQKMRNKI